MNLFKKKEPSECHCVAQHAVCVSVLFEDMVNSIHAFVLFKYLSVTADSVLMDAVDGH